VGEKQSGGDQIRIGNISGSSGIAVGRGARASVSRGVSGAELSRLFEHVYRQVEERPGTSAAQKSEISATVKSVHREAGKGARADTGKIEGWLKTLANLAPDILDVTIASLTSPIAGISAAVRKIAERARSNPSEG
jgi:hypothetical protein